MGKHTRKTADPLFRASKLMSLVLRHKPEAIGLTLDKNGWASIDELVKCSKGRLTHALIDEAVATNDKQRFALSDDKQHVRANQGHSVDINLDLSPLMPPEILFHGTASRFLESIMAKGLLAGTRQHVHLSVDQETAHKVGSRHGQPVILNVMAYDMHHDGHAFYRSKNGVWLTDHVPVRYLSH